MQKILFIFKKILETLNLFIIIFNFIFCKNKIKLNFILRLNLILFKIKIM